MKRDRRPRRTAGRPFWLPAPSFYFLAFAVAIGVFFISWGILAEAKDDRPWIASGLMASVSMIAAVVIREVIVRHRRNSIFSAQKRLDSFVLTVPGPVRRDPDSKKLTLERNAMLLEEIERRSDAATVLDHLPESHREVFSLCSHYIEVATKELPTVGVGSPRLAAIKRGRDRAEKLHRHHMLRWAELEIQAHTGHSKNDRISVRINGASKALRAVDKALQNYPDHPKLVESRSAIERFILSGRVAEMVQRANRAESKGDLERSLANLSDAKLLIEENIWLFGEDSGLDTILADIDRISSMIK